MVLTDEGTCLPVLAEVPRVIVEQVWLAAEIVPVMSVDTLGLVVRLDVGAPLSLKVVHIERRIALHFMDQARLDVFVGVSKGTELLIIADVPLVGAELSLVLFDMVKPFHPIMGSQTRFLLVTFFRIRELT